MGKRKRLNQYDVLVESFIREFSKVKNFHLTQDDPVGKQVFNTLSFRIADFHSYKQLVCGSYIPAANKAIVQAKDEVRRSKYKGLSRITDEQFRETLNETVRLAYVGLFHKLESFVKETVEIADLIFAESAGPDFSIIKYAKDTYDFQILPCWLDFHTFHKINWVANCTKHYDGYPLKDKRPIEFLAFPKQDRMRLTKEDFKRDCEELIQFSTQFLQLILGIAQRKVVMNHLIDYPNDEIEDQIMELDEHFEKLLKVCKARYV